MSTKALEWPEGYGHSHSARVGSTLDEAGQRGPDYITPTWFTADEQSAPRGRRGRAWIDPPGNFKGALSLPEPEPTAAAQRSFVAALALYDAISKCAPGQNYVSLKWPNDVLLNGGKVAGILLEGIQVKGKFWGVAIGIGVNLAEAPAAVDVEERAIQPVSLKSAVGSIPSTEEFTTLLARTYAAWEETFASQGFASIRVAWLARAAFLGENLTARLTNEEITGRFETVDENGHLVLTTPVGPRVIAAADIYF